MPLSHRKSTSPRQTSRHNPVQPASSSLHRAWFTLSIAQADPGAGSASFELSNIRTPTLNSPAVDLNVDGRYNESGRGIYVLTADGETHEPVAVVFGGAGFTIQITFGLGGYGGQNVTIVVEPDQNRIVIGASGRLAGGALTAGII